MNEVVRALVVNKLEGGVLLLFFAAVDVSGASVISASERLMLISTL